VPWYAANRDLADPPYGRTCLYNDPQELQQRFGQKIAEADVVIVGSYVPDGVAVGSLVTGTARGLTAFYDIDTPVTLAKLDRGDYEYLSPQLIPRYGLYLSFTGGPILRRLEQEFGSPRAVPLYCSADTALYFPEDRPRRWELGYLGTYSADRQPALQRLLLEPALCMDMWGFAVAGPQYPAEINWPANVQRIEHLPPSQHRSFYSQQSFTLNVTRQDMVRAGFSPSIRLFEAAACGVPVISDWWEGLDSFFDPESEIFVAGTAEDVLRILLDTSEEERLEVGRRARARALSHHTAARRASELEQYVLEASGPAQTRRESCSKGVMRRWTTD
jgi:spore maturation protein CgeB